MDHKVSELTDDGMAKFLRHLLKIFVLSQIDRDLFLKLTAFQKILIETKEFHEKVSSIADADFKILEMLDATAELANLYRRRQEENIEGTNEAIKTFALKVNPDISRSALEEILKPINHDEIKGPLENARQRTKFLFPDISSGKSSIHKEQQRISQARAVAKKSEAFVALENNEVLTALVLDMILKVPISEIQEMPYIKNFIKDSSLLPFKFT